MINARLRLAAFWVVGAAFALNLGFSAVPTSLYVIYQSRDHFSTLMITVVYAIGVIASLFLGGHVSDWVGRRRVLVPALAVNVLSAMLFMAFPSLIVADHPWHPQRVAIPADRRGTFFAATGAAAAAFAVFGVFNSLMPAFLAGTMHETSYAVAGAAGARAVLRRHGDHR